MRRTKIVRVCCLGLLCSSFRNSTCTGTPPSLRAHAPASAKHSTFVSLAQQMGPVASVSPSDGAQPLALFHGGALLLALERNIGGRRVSVSMCMCVSLVSL